MSNVCFAFGPDNSFLLNCPAKWARNNLPSALETLFTKQYPIKDIYEVALGPGGSYYIGYKDYDFQPYCIHDGLPHHLTQWLSARNAQGYTDHDIPTTTVTLGPDGSYVVKDSTKMQWFGIPEPLVARLSSHGALGTRMVSLGIDNTYVVINTDGSGLRQLKGRYPRLEQHMASMTNLDQVHYLSLSTFQSTSAFGAPDVPLFSLALKNGTGEALAPSGHEEKFKEAIRILPNMLQPHTSLQTTIGSSAHPQSHPQAHPQSPPAYSSRRTSVQSPPLHAPTPVRPIGRVTSNTAQQAQARADTAAFMKSLSNMAKTADHMLTANNQQQQNQNNASSAYVIAGDTGGDSSGFDSGYGSMGADDGGASYFDTSTFAAASSGGDTGGFSGGDFGGGGGDFGGGGGGGGFGC